MDRPRRYNMKGLEAEAQQHQGFGSKILASVTGGASWKAEATNK